MAPSSDPVTAPPTVVTWFKVYCGALGALYIGVTAFSIPFFVANPRELDTTRPVALVLGAVFLTMGIAFAAVSLLPLVVRPAPWVWVYDLVVICLGLTSACCIPFCVPLLIYWMRPETKAYFGRT